MLGAYGDSRAGVCPQWRGNNFYFYRDHGNYGAVWHDDVCLLSRCPAAGCAFLICFIGIIAAFFFFAVREVYATILVVAVCSVFTMADRINPSYVQNAVPLCLDECGSRSQCFDGYPPVSFTELYDLKDTRNMTGTFLV